MRISCVKSLLNAGARACCGWGVGRAEGGDDDVDACSVVCAQDRGPLVGGERGPSQGLVGGATGQPERKGAKAKALDWI